MDIGAVIALSSIAATVGVLALIVGGAWALGRQYEQRNAGRLNTERQNAFARGGNAEEMAARLARIERMLETLSTDVERIAAESRPPLLPRR